MSVTIGNPNWVQAITYAAADDRTVLRALYAGQGVVSLSVLGVTQNGTPNMSVNVGAGQAVINRTGSSPADYYIAESPNASTNLAIAASDPTNPRKDIVVITVNDAQYAGGTNNAILQVITGTPAPSPVVPTTPNNSVLLAIISVAANATTIVTANISDQRTLFQEAGGIYSTLVFTSSGSITAQQAAGARALRIEGVNGGNGGGGAAAGNVNIAAGSPGCGAPGAIRTVSTAGLVYPLQVTVGAVGAGGAAGANTGATGGQSSVITNNGAGTTIWTPGTNQSTAPGGGGSASATLGEASSVGFNGSGTGAVADVQLSGQNPAPPIRVSTTAVGRTPGGSSAYGGGGYPGSNGPGAGAGFGGGGGAVANSTSSGVAGSPGGGGLVLVTLLF